MAKRVYILTFCDRLDQLYGNLLVFKTLRTGFPTAEVHVIDNASILQARQIIRQHSDTCGAKFIQLQKRIRHDSYFETALLKDAPDTVIFVDPDICFWESVEDWHFDVLMAGRAIPAIACEQSGCITRPRLHTSFLWVPNVPSFVATVRALCDRYWDFLPFRPIMFSEHGQWHRFDTGGQLYAAIEDRTYAFQEKELNSYDHLFCGTHSWKASSTLSGDNKANFDELHSAVRADYRALRGAWRKQEKYFQSRTVEVRVTARSMVSGTPAD